MRKRLSEYAYLGLGCLTIRIVRPRRRELLATRLLLTATVRRREPEYWTTARVRPLEDRVEREEPVLLDVA
ncbi:MAG: hypothetical protein K2Y39_07630 [Candidatus Obscuribacterales bacterium]|nr:hypothetical protein [Candidatus Obscuribacterales bacterium]